MIEIIDFSIRWKEELVAKTQFGSLIFEFTMGENHVYFPSKELWINNCPDWAKDKWETYYDACNRWCKSKHNPISIAENTFFYSETI